MPKESVNRALKESKDDQTLLRELKSAVAADNLLIEEANQKDEVAKNNAAKAQSALKSKQSRRAKDKSTKSKADGIEELKESVTAMTAQLEAQRTAIEALTIANRLESAALRRRLDLAELRRLDDISAVDNKYRDKYGLMQLFVDFLDGVLGIVAAAKARFPAISRIGDIAHQVQEESKVGATEPVVTTWLVEWLASKNNPITLNDFRLFDRYLRIPRNEMSHPRDLSIIEVVPMLARIENDVLKDAMIAISSLHFGSDVRPLLPRNE